MKIHIHSILPIVADWNTPVRLASAFGAFTTPVTLPQRAIDWLSITLCLVV